MSLGELLVDYRTMNNVPQTEFAARLNVDVRTVSRWEKDITLIKPEKEEELVEETFIPYQVIRNLNASVAIPTYYDFNIRKYALSEMTRELPEADWFFSHINQTTKRIRPIEFESDFENILRHTQFQYNSVAKIDKKLIREAARRLPELNLIIFDDAGYYSGHSVYFPLKYSSYLKLRNREIKEGELTIDDLDDYRNTEQPIFHNYDMAADCNENMFYLVAAVMRFFRDFAKDNYLYSSLVVRSDTRDINKNLGFS